MRRVELVSVIQRVFLSCMAKYLLVFIVYKQFYIISSSLPASPYSSTIRHSHRDTFSQLVPSG